MKNNITLTNAKYIWYNKDGEGRNLFAMFRKSFLINGKVEKAEINYWPVFLAGKIPAYESRVSIELDNN